MDSVFFVHFPLIISNLLLDVMLIDILRPKIKIKAPVMVKTGGGGHNG